MNTDVSEQNAQLREKKQKLRKWINTLSVCSVITIFIQLFTSGWVSGALFVLFIVFVLAESFLHGLLKNQSPKKALMGSFKLALVVNIMCLLTIAFAKLFQVDVGVALVFITIIYFTLLKTKYGSKFV